ncbi:hypothetical protein WDU94_011490 [Cyamophila willieti]
MPHFCLIVCGSKNKFVSWHEGDLRHDENSIISGMTSSQIGQCMAVSSFFFTNKERKSKSSPGGSMVN